MNSGSGPVPGLKFRWRFRFYRVFLRTYWDILTAIAKVNCAGIIPLFEAKSCFRPDEATRSGRDETAPHWMGGKQEMERKTASSGSRLASCLARLGRDDELQHGLKHKRGRNIRLAVMRYGGQILSFDL